MNLLAKYFKKKINANGVAQALYQLDTDTGFWGAPNVARHVQTDLKQDTIFVSHNSDGNRGEEISKIDSDGSIVTIGGSHSWGGGIEHGERYSELLSQRTGKQVINLGHASLGIDQACIAIMKKTQKFNPRVIVVEQYPWAVIRILSGYVNGYVKPVFSLDEDGQLKLKKVPASVKFSLGRKLVGSYYSFKKELQEFRSGIDLQHNYDPLTDPIFLYWKINHYDYLYTLLKKIIIVMRDYCRKQNIHLVFALGAIHQQFIGSNKSDLVDYELPKKRLIHILNDLSIPYVDVSEALLDANNENDPVIFHDGHINEKGHDIFSQVLQKELEDRCWI